MTNPEMTKQILHMAQWLINGMIETYETTGQLNLPDLSQFSALLALDMPENSDLFRPVMGELKPFTKENGHADTPQTPKPKQRRKRRTKEQIAADLARSQPATGATGIDDRDNQGGQEHADGILDRGFSESLPE